MFDIMAMFLSLFYAKPSKDSIFELKKFAKKYQNQPGPFTTLD